MPYRIHIGMLFLAGLLLGACTSLRGYQRLPADQEPPWRLTAPLKGKVLYKTQLDVFGRHLSGLLLFNPVPDDSTYRVVMLSEFGLSLFDYSFHQEGARLMSCQDFLNRPQLMNSMANTLGLLMYTPLTKKSPDLYKAKGSDNIAFKVKGKKGKYIYFYNDRKDLTKIVKSSGLWNRLEVNFSGNNPDSPGTITFSNSPVRYSMKLSLLNTEN